jgi:methyltransferase (TIGR00027 family)
MQRTDGDTWDVASSVGATATMTAAARAAATKATNPVVVDPFAEPLVRAVGIDFFTRWAAGDLYDDSGESVNLGWRPISELVAVRTKFIDELLLDVAADGIRQVVILAAGLDSRAYRLPWPSATTVFEIDQPQVIAFKSATLADLGAHPTADLRSIGIDLRDDWMSALGQAGFDAQRPTVWIAEGLLAYLPPASQDRLLDDITGLSAKGSRLMSETLHHCAPATARLAASNVNAQIALWQAHGLDIDLTGLLYQGDRNDVANYLDAKGWTTITTPAAELFAANGLARTSDADDDVFAGSSFCNSSLAL